MDTDDQPVARLHRFEAGHPEWEIISPQDTRSQVRGEYCWRALGPGGLIREYELSDLLDKLDKLT